MAAIPSRIANDPRIQMPNPFSKASQARLEQARAIAQTSKAIVDEQYREVRLSAVVGDSPLQARAPFNPEQDADDQALLESIASDGQRVPVLLVETARPEHTLLEYSILDGHRRIAALRQLNREAVKAVIVRHDSLECDLITLTANVRKHLTPLEQARVIARLRERHGLMLEEIAKRVGLSARYVTDAFPDLDAEVVQVLTECAVKRSASAQVVKVAGLFVLVGQDVEPALDAALPIINTQGVRKVVHILDSIVDLRGLIRHSRCAPECAPLLAALSKQLLALKQAVVSSKRSHKKPTAPSKHGQDK